MKISDFLAVLLTSSIGMLGCQSTEIGSATDVNPETIYQDLRLIYEGGDEVTCRAYLRFAGEKGTTLVLGKNGKVMIDDKVLTVDSSDGSGAYYQAHFNTRAFTGKHQWVYTDVHGKEYHNNFVFDPLTIAPENGTIARNEPIALSVSGISNGMKLDVVADDTSDATASFDTTFVLQGNKVVIPASFTAKQKTGPIQIRASSFHSTNLSQATPEGGHIVYNYDANPVSVVLEGKKTKLSITRP
jgi:hypothetical protein